MKTSNNQYSLKFLGATVRKSRTFLKPAISLLCGVFLSQISFAGNIEMATGSKFINAGRVVIKADTGKFKSDIAPANYSTDFKNKGTIELAGTAATIDGVFMDMSGAIGGATAPGSSALARIPGRVIYNDSASGAQKVQSRWYDTLQFASTATKTVGDSIYIGGAGKAFTIGSGTVGARTYGSNSYVIYDGATVDQTLLEDETYTNLKLVNGNVANKKTLASGTSITVTGTFEKDTTDKSNLEIFGTLNVQKSAVFDAQSGTVTVGDGTNAAVMNFAYNSAAAIADSAEGGDWTIAKGAQVILGTSTAAAGNTTKFNTNVNLNAEGKLLVSKSDMTIATGKTFALPANANSAINFQVDAGNTVVVNGSLTSADTEGDNVTFDVTSTFKYGSATAQTILATADANPYGNLTLTGDGVKTVARNGNPEDLHVKGETINFENGNLDMFASGDKTLVLNHSTSSPISITYSSDSVEVVGKMQYKNKTFAGTQDYALNNAKTFINFATPPSVPMDFTMSSRPNTIPTNYGDTVDVKRKTNITYSVDNGWIAALKVGYRLSETGLPALAGGSGLWDPSFTEEMLRMYESSVTTTDIEKLGGQGFTYTRVAGANTPSLTLGSVKLTSIEPQTAPGTLDGTTDRFFLSGQDLVLRSGPAVITSVTSGRWSNPGTWDENAEPKTIDQVMIKHTVHAGYTRTIDANFATPEATPAAMASKITIAASDNVNFPAPSLLLGGAVAYGISDTDQAGMTNEGSLTLNGIGTQPVNEFTNFDDLTGTSTVFNAGLVIHKDASLWIKENLNNKGGIVQVGDGNATLTVGK